MDEGADVPISRKIDFQREKMKYATMSSKNELHLAKKSIFFISKASNLSSYRKLVYFCIVLRVYDDNAAYFLL